MSPSHKYGSLVNLTRLNPAGSNTSFTKLVTCSSKRVPFRIMFCDGLFDDEPKRKIKLDNHETFNPLTDDKFFTLPN